jgi:hypothetical protein
MRKEFREVLESTGKDEFSPRRVAKLGRQIRKCLKKTTCKFEEECVMENLVEELQIFLANLQVAG